MGWVPCSTAAWQLGSCGVRAANGLGDRQHQADGPGELGAAPVER